MSGSLYRITGDIEGGHHFDIGEIVRKTGDSSDGPYEHLDGSDHWWVAPSGVEPYYGEEPEPQPLTLQAVRNQLTGSGMKPEVDMVNQPPHYTAHPSGVECIQITEHMGFNLGNVIKYVWRADLKHEDTLIDLEKARYYLDREIERRVKQAQ